VNPVFLAWGAEIGVITVRDLAGQRRLPLPSELLATFVVFGGLSVIAGNPTARPAANATAWGLVLATLIVAYAPLEEGGLASKLLAPVGDFLAGKGPTSQPGQNATAAQQLAQYRGPAPTVGSGAGDTGNILAPYMKG
jgi:hypothetical protein